MLINRIDFVDELNKVNISGGPEGPEFRVIIKKL